MNPGDTPRETAEVETHRRLVQPPDAVPLALFPRRLRIWFWAAAAVGGIVGLVFGRLHFIHIVTIPGFEGLFSMEPPAFHAFWLFAGVAAGILAAAIRTLIAEKPRTAFPVDSGRGLP